MTAQLGVSLAPIATRLPQPLRFAGTGFRFPTSTTTIDTNIYRAGDMAFGTDREIAECYLFFPAFAAPTGGETDTDGYIVQGIAFRASDGTRTLCQIDDGTDPITVSAGSTTTPGRWIKVTPASPIAANTVGVFSIAQQFVEGAVVPGARARTVAQTSIFGGTMRDERGQGSTSSLVSTLTGSSNYTNVGGGIVYPSLMIARRTSGGDPVFALVGDSILYGADQSSASIFFTERHEFGWVAMGFDDVSQGRRIAYGNFGIPGWGFIDTQTSGSHGNATASARQIRTVELGMAINAGLPLCDEIFIQHGTNSSTAAIADIKRSYRSMYTLWRDTFGVSTVTQAEMLAYPTGTTDGFQTVANQTLTAANTYPTGQRWQANEAIGKGVLLGDATAEFRADGSIQHSVAAWRALSADAADDRDRLAIPAAATTLAADWSGSGPVQITSLIEPGTYVYISEGGSYRQGVLRTRSGSGPYTYDITLTGGSGSFTAAGAVVQPFWGGLHPSPRGHKKIADDIIGPYKQARGWTIPAATPVLSGVSLDGFAEPNKTLVVEYTVTGFPIPTVTFQWQKNGTNISGQTSQTITLDEAGMGLSNGDTISCEITATNSEGSDSAEPTATYSNVLPTTIIDTSDFDTTGGTAGYQEVIDIDSFRICRNSGGAGRFTFTLPSAGTYRFIGTLSAYDGAQTGITTRNFQVNDNFTLVGTATAAGAFDFTATFTGTTARVLYGTVGDGCRVDDFNVSAVP